MPNTGARAVDGVFVLVVLVTGIAEVWGPLASRQGSGDEVVSTVQVVAVALALWWRRSQPVATVAIVAAGLILPNVMEPGFLLFCGQFVPLAIATFSVARHAKGNTPWLGGLIVGGTLVYADLFIPLMGGINEMIYHWGVLGVCFAVGRWQATMARRAERSRQQAVRAEAAAAEAVLTERKRIARELHDIVAHAMSVMVVQAGAAEQVVDADPAQARRSLEAIRATGAGALDELRRLVGMLREDGDVGALTPQPGLAGLRDLIDDAADGGLPVSLDVAGAQRELPAGVDLAAYRIVQESLTNARRHAVGATRVEVSARFLPEALEVEVEDDGHGSPATVGTGHGLVGMQERAAFYDGTLVAGALPARGFRVVARLPLAPVLGATS